MYVKTSFKETAYFPASFKIDSRGEVFQFGNPGLSRIASRINSQSQAELLTMIQLLLPGTNNIYYGDEIGMIDLPLNATVS